MSSKEKLSTSEHHHFKLGFKRTAKELNLVSGIIKLAELQIFQTTYKYKNQEKLYFEQGNEIDV